MPSRRALLLFGSTCSVKGGKFNQSVVRKSTEKAKIKKDFSCKVSKGSTIGKTAANKKPRLFFGKIHKSLKDEDVSLLVGPSAETWLHHCQRHPDTNKWAASCARCAFEVWARTNHVPKWMSWKPSTEGGVGGVGCRFCAASRKSPLVNQRRCFLLAEYKKKGMCKQSLCRRSFWSVYGVRRLFHSRQFASAITMHEKTDAHRMASDVFNSQEFHLSSQGSSNNNSFRLPSLLGTPENERKTLVLQAASSAVPEQTRVAEAASSASGCTREATCTTRYLGQAGSVLDPFRGNVPPVSHWQDCWAHSTERISLFKQSRLQEKQGRAKRTIRNRKQSRKLVLIMAAVRRIMIRKNIEEAQSITLGLDESKTRKIIRIRGDAPQHPFVFDAVLGIVSKSYEAEDTASSLREDHAQHASKELEGFLKRFFTPLATKKRGRAAREQPAASFCAEELARFRKKVRVLTSDGGAAERRALFFEAQTFFYNVKYLIRDLAHAIRIATQVPLRIESMYKEVFEELMDKRHALIPDITNSGKWKKMLMAIQQQAFTEASGRGHHPRSIYRQGALRVVMQHLSFAKQRMDSAANPLVKFCLMLMPMVLLLSFISTDTRCKQSQRDGASEILRKFQTKFLHAAGVAADWGLISIAFLRLYSLDYNNVQRHMFKW
jgi:hypothetical protein